MDHLLPIGVSDEIRRVLPELRVHAMVFDGARIGVGHGGLDPLRSRVVRRVDELAERHGDLADIPSVRAMITLLEGLGQDPRRHPPTFLQRAQAMARRDPFLVENDARDTTLMLSLYYMVPVFLLDAVALRPPLMLQPSAHGHVMPTPTGPVDSPGALVLADNEKVLRSVQHEIGRAPVMEMTQKFVIILIDPGVDGGLDPERTSQRIDNWLSALTSAELLKATVSP